MKRTHSPEPWKASGEGRIESGVGSEMIAFVGVGNEEGRANLRRILVAVNFCAGSPTGVLEQNTLAGVLELLNDLIDVFNDDIYTDAPECEAKVSRAWDLIMRLHEVAAKFETRRKP